MNPSKRTAILALTAALSLAGCNRAGHTPDNNPENAGNLPANTLNAPSSEPTSEPTEESKSTSNDQARANDSEFGPIVATPGAQVAEAPRVAQAPAVHTKQVKAEPSKDKESQDKAGIFARSGDGLQRGWNWTTGAIAAVGSWFTYQGSVAYHAVRPNDKTVGRRDAMAVHHDRITETRAAEPSELAKLKDKIGQLSPNAARIESVLRPNNETKRQLARVLTEQNPENVEGASSRLVEDIFKTPDTADGKILQVQLALRELAANDAYDEAASARIVLLQTEIDKRITADNASAAALRGGTIGLAMLAGGVFTGLNGVNRTTALIERNRAKLHAIPFRRVVADGQDVVEKDGAKAWSRAKTGVNNVVGKTGSTVKGAYEGAVGAVTGAVAQLRGSMVKLTPKEIMVRDLTTIFAKTGAYTEDDAAALLKRLQLKKGSLKQLSSLESNVSEEVSRDVNPKLVGEAVDAALGATVTVSQQTRNPSIKVKLVQKLKGFPDANEGQYFVTFTKSSGLGKRTEFYHTVAIERQEAADLAELLVKDAPKRELRTVAIVGDEVVEASEADAIMLTEARRVSEATATEAGDATLTADGSLKLTGTRAIDSAESVADLKGEKVAENADVNAIIDGTKAGADSAIKTSTDAVNKGLAVAGDVSKKGAARLKEFGNKSKENLQKEYNRFNLVKAGIGALGVGLPTYLISRSAYFQGHHHGEGYDALYLEDLIPPNRLQRVIIKSDGSSRAAE